MSSSSSNERIRTLNPRDVLLGRGHRCREYPGTQLFLDLCRAEQDEFHSSNRHETKHIIAYRVLNAVHDGGGRFLHCCGNEEFTELSREAALKKIKQSIRDSCRRRRKVKERIAGDAAPVIANFTGSDAAVNSQRNKKMDAVESTAKMNTLNPIMDDKKDIPGSIVGPSTKKVPGAEEQYTPDEHEAAEQLFSLLATTYESVPMITPEDAQSEQAHLTETERTAALQDLFGKSRDNHAASGTSPTRSCLLQDMRRVVWRLSKDSEVLDKVLKADETTWRRELSDGRLELFLRRHGMDPQKAAHHFLKYWQKRHELFGPEKFLSPMTISEALSGKDLIALRTGTYQLLPSSDSSKRRIMLANYTHDTRDGYTSENLLRAFWYLHEQIAREGEINFLFVIWAKDITVWDYDQGIDSQVHALVSDYLPVRMSATHVCCPPLIIIYLIRPIAQAVQGKHIRIRTRIHDVPPSQIVSVLAEYGISRDALPTYMGGTLELSQPEWISNRISLEARERQARERQETRGEHRQNIPNEFTLPASALGYTI